MLSLLLLSAISAAPTPATFALPSNYPHTVIHDRMCKATNELEICQYDTLAISTVGYFPDEVFGGYEGPIVLESRLKNGATGQSTYSTNCFQNRHPMRGMQKYCMAQINGKVLLNTHLVIGPKFDATMRLNEFIKIKQTA